MALLDRRERERDRPRAAQTTPASGSARCCAATTTGSSSASARRSRTTRLAHRPRFPLVIGRELRLGHTSCCTAASSIEQPHRHGRSCSTVRNRSNCLVGAGALVTEGKEFPDNSLIVARRRAQSARSTTGEGGDRARRRYYVRRWQRCARLNGSVRAARRQRERDRDCHPPPSVAGRARGAAKRASRLSHLRSAKRLTDRNQLLAMTGP